MSTDNSHNEYHSELKLSTGEISGIILFIALVLFFLIIHILSIVDVARHCKENQLVQLLLVIFVPFYAIVYFFIKKSMCPRNPF